MPNRNHSGVIYSIIPKFVVADFDNTFSDLFGCE